MTPDLARHSTPGEVEKTEVTLQPEQKSDEPFTDQHLVAEGGSQGSDTDLTMLSKDALNESLDPVYAAKATVLNNALQEIGMGRYQWELFILVAFGWASDNSWLIVTSLILKPIENEFRPDRPTYLTLSQNLGLVVGAFFWGFGCDIIGRKWAFNLTILIASVFGLISAGSPNFAAICTFDALWSFGVGG